jgi:hypothetical protein
MDEHDNRRVGEHIEPGGRPNAPGRLGLLQRSITSYNHDFPREWDRLGTIWAETRWCGRGPASRFADADGG